MDFIHTHAAPAPAGHYTQAIVHNGFVFVSGQLAVDPVSGEKRLGTIAEQTQQALYNLEAILKAAGSGKEQVLKTTVYIANIALWDEVNQVYAAFFGSHKPARSIVPTRDLHFGFLVEIEAVAAVAS
jgi:2-iminobutanoate/2-iminopropanoate deaminase